MKHAFYKGQRGKFTKANRSMTSVANVALGNNVKLGFHNAVIYTDGDEFKVLMLGNQMLRTPGICVSTVKVNGKASTAAETVTLSSVHIDTDIVGYADVDLTTGFRVLGERIVTEINRGTFDVTKLIYCRKHREYSIPTVLSWLVNGKSSEPFYIEA